MKNDSSASSFAGAFRSPLGAMQSLLGSVRPPEWVVDEVQNRVVLFLNHVLMQEPQAQQRLRRQLGKPVRVQWGDFHLSLAATPAGLVERASGELQPQLHVTLTQTSPLTMVRQVMTGERPAVDIQGDVQLAAEVAWLVDNVRWDVEEDLARVVGDSVAHTLVGGVRSAVAALRSFVERRGAAGAAHGVGRSA